MDLPTDLPKILADQRALQQIWLNLLSNAIKFTPPGGKIAISAVKTPAGGLDVLVRDSGYGIPPEEARSMTEAFTRGSFAERKAIDGAGLGLAIVKGLARLHNADVVINSVVDQGTEVTVRFPPSRVLSGPRGEVLAAASVATDSQRKLIVLTGETPPRRVSH